MPYFDLSADAYSEMPTRGRKGEGGYLAAEGEVVKNDATSDIGEDSTAVLIYREQEVAAGVQRKAGDVPAMREGKCVGFGALS